MTISHDDLRLIEHKLSEIGTPNPTLLHPTNKITAIIQATSRPPITLTQLEALQHTKNGTRNEAKRLPEAFSRLEHSQIMA